MEELANTFWNFKEKEFLKPIEIKNKEKYSHDLANIDRSWTGRLDATLANTFIIEAQKLLVNSIALFELGYFDCAYYSLRESIEVSTTMIYLSDLSDREGEKALKNWKELRNFPMQSQMLKHLKEYGNIYRDIKEQMSNFFTELFDISQKLNKKVHKQGLRNFYVSRNHPISFKDRSSEIYLKEFEYFLKKCIMVVAIMRLSIDPFPLLLADAEIYLRTDDTLTEPYENDFIEEYIGKENIECYKHTQIYKSYYDYFMQKEKKFQSVANIVKFQYIDSDKEKEIFSQLHLLREFDLIAVKLIFLNEKIYKIYTYNGLLFYYTNRMNERDGIGFDSRIFLEFKKLDYMFNIPYNKSYISIIKIKKDEWFMEHRNKFDETEISRLKELEKEFNN